MNKRQSEVAKHLLSEEEAILKEVEKQYRKALRDIDDTLARMLGRDDANLQNVIYRIEHQKALRAQVAGVLNQLHSKEFETISDFLTASYTTAFVGSVYDMHGQGVPLILPIDPKNVVKAVVTESKINDGLYAALGVDVSKMKKSISAEISRGIASGMSYNEIARNLSAATGAPLGRVRTIVRTESHRIQQASCYDAQRNAKAKGADVVKQWDATLDGNTRDSHRQLDGQIRELDEAFAIGGSKAMYPGAFGDPAEDCNCRCQSLQRAKWNLGEEELQTLKDRAEFFGLDKTESFEEFAEKYKSVETLQNIDDKLELLEERLANSRDINEWIEIEEARDRIMQEKAKLLKEARQKEAARLVSASEGQLKDGYFINDPDKFITQIDLSGCDPRCAASAVEAYNKVFEKVPIMKGKLSGITTEGKLPNGAMASTSPLGGLVTLNNGYFKDFDRLSKICADNVAKGLLVERSPEELVIHEIGHAFSMLAKNNWLTEEGIAKMATAGTVAEKVRNAVLADIGGNLSALSISAYASHNADEWFAETWTLYITGRDESAVVQSFARQIEKLAKRTR